MKRIGFLVLLVLIGASVGFSQLNNSHVLKSDSSWVKNNWTDSTTVFTSSQPFWVRVQVPYGSSMLGIAVGNDTTAKKIIRVNTGETGVYIPLWGKFVRFKALKSNDSCLVIREIY